MTITEINTQETTATVSVDAPQLVRAFKNALLFASTDRARPVLCAVHLSVFEGLATVTATDSYGLFTQTIAVDTLATVSGLIDRDDAKRIIDLLKDQPAGDVTLTMSDMDLTVIDYRKNSLTFALTYGQYPDCAYIRSGHASGASEVLGFGTKLLAKLTKVDTAVKMKDRTGNPMRIESGATNLKPTLVTYPHDESIEVFVMPIRLSDIS